MAEPSDHNIFSNLKGHLSWAYAAQTTGGKKQGHGRILNWVAHCWLLPSPLDFVMRD